MTPELFITVIRESNDLAETIYTKGGCYKFFKILEAKYPEAEAYYNGDHVITKIDGNYYDITGKVEKENHLRMTQVEQDEAETWKKETIMADTLNKENIKALADTLGVTVEKLTDAITKEDAKLEIPKGDFFSEEELSKRDSSKYNEGKDAGQEMLVKEAKKKYSYDFEGKGIDDLLKHHEITLEATSNRDKSEWQKDFEKQKEAYETELDTVRKEKEQFVNQFRQQKVTNKLLSLMPKDTTIKKDAIITLFNSEYGVIEEDGQTFVTKGGEKLKDPKTSDPLSIDNVFSEYVTKEGYIKAPTGRGGDNDNGNGSNKYASKTVESFQKEWQDKNPDKSTTSQDYVKDYTEFRNAQKSA